MESIFAKISAEQYPYRFAGQLFVSQLLGGVPNDPKIAEGWLRKKLSGSNEAFLQQLIAETAVERGISGEDAAKVVKEERTVNGFKRDPERGGELYIEGRQLKAAIKEAVSVAGAAGRIEMRGWGKTNKGILSFVAEHVFVVERRLYLGRTEPDAVLQGFVHTFRGNSIKYEELAENVTLDFTVISDYDFKAKDWAAIWTTGENQGIGASRSQGYGTYAVTRWEAQS